MKTTFVRIVLSLALALCGITLRATPALAGGTIFAAITLTNNTSQCIAIPFSGASTGQLWGTQGNTLQNESQFEVMPDGSPPRMLGAGQTMFWGTKSNGGTLATTGTGGSLSIPLGSGETANLNWSVPWALFNGNFQFASGWASISSAPGFQSGSPFTIAGGVDSCSGDGPNTCLFSFGLSGGPPGPTFTPGEADAPQCISMPTHAPPARHATWRSTSRLRTGRLPSRFRALEASVYPRSRGGAGSN